MSIIEMDGPPLAYFWDDEEANKYKTIAAAGKQPNDIVTALNDSIEKIRDALGSGIIYWRLRPEFVGSDLREVTGRYSIRCRVTTSPQLSREFWESLDYLKLEGDDYKIVSGDES